MCCLSHSSVVPPALPNPKCGLSRSASCCLVEFPLCPRFPSPPLLLDECFFFNSLVFGLLYSLIFCQFWLFLLFELVVILLLVLQGRGGYLPMLHLARNCRTIRLYLFKALFYWLSQLSDHVPVNAVFWGTGALIGKMRTMTPVP